MGAFDDLLPRSTGGVFDDLIPGKDAEKATANPFGDLIPEASGTPSVLKTVALENPLTAAGEMGINLASQAVAIPIAGLSGLAVEAGNAMGLTDKNGADAVHAVGNALTYRPRSEMGRMGAEAIAFPFEKLAEAGQWAGGKTLEATDSPMAATVVDTAVNALPMLIDPAIRSAKRSKAGEVSPEHPANPVAENAPDAQATAAQAAPAPAPMKIAEVEAATHRPAAIDDLHSMDPITPMQDGVAKQHPPGPTGEYLSSETAPGKLMQDQGLIPEIPVIGPLSRAADVAVKQGAHPERPATMAAEVFPESRSGMGDVAGEPRVMAMQGGSGAIGRAAKTMDTQADSVAPTTLSARAEAPEVHNSWAPGANYAPLIDDALAQPKATTTANLPPPIRREHIISDLARDLGAAVYEGRVKGKNRLGFFRTQLEEVRIKRTNDLEVAAHEIAHLVDSRIPELGKAMHADKALAAELRGISYDKSSLAEGFAEGMRLWMTQPDVLQARAPKVASWLDEFAGQHAYGPALKRAQEQMTGWFGQDALNRARSKIGTHNRLSEHLDRAFDKFRQSTVDDLHGIYQMERQMTGGQLEKVGAYETARLSRASASIADGAVRFGYVAKKADGSFEYKGKGLQEILEPVSGKLDDTLLYFVGRSSKELMEQGREHLFSKGEINAMLGLETPEAKRAFAEYQAWNKGILDFAEAQGVINPESRRLWQRTQYLPFHRVAQPGGIKGKPGDWTGVKALTGGTENIRDVLGNMIGNAAMLIDKAVKNEARLKVAELASRPGGGRFMVKIDPSSRPVKIAADQVIGEMFKRYGLALDRTAPDFFEFMVHGQPPAGHNVVAVLKDGKPVWYEVADPILYRSLVAMDRPPMHWLTRWLGMPKRVGQAAITMTPDFMLANIARDTIMGSVMSRAGFRPILDSLKGMQKRMSNDPLYREYIANGGGLSSMFLDEQKVRAKLEKFYTRQGIDYRTVLDTPDKLLNFVETLGDAFEMSTRLGEYGRAIQRGEHPRHAAYLGREVSTDFAMKGDSKALGFMYDTVMFLRPAVVSWDRLYRGVAHDPNKAAIGAKAASIALASAALYLLNKDDPRYADLPDWDRDANWHFFIGDQHFRYPKIWEIGSLASMAERSTEKLIQKDPEGLGKDFARIVGHTFNLNLMPQILAPLYQQATNQNGFTGSPIETPGMENVQPFLRAKPGTSETMKALGMMTRDMPESLQVNPVRSEALLRGYLNTWAAYGLMLSDQAFFGDQLPEMRTDQLPVVRRFYAQEPARHTRFETEFYDMLNEARRLQGTLRELDKLGRSDLADQKERNPLTGEAKPLERASKTVQQINAEMMLTHRDKTLTSEEKRQRIDELTIEKNALLKATVLDAKAAQALKKQ